MPDKAFRMVSLLSLFTPQYADCQASSVNARLLFRHGDLKPRLGGNQMVVIVGGDAGVEFHPIDLPCEFGGPIPRIVGRDRRPRFMTDVQGLLSKGERFG